MLLHWSDVIWTCKQIPWRQIPCANYFTIITYFEIFLYFFPNQVFQKIDSFYVLAWENQAFSESCSLIRAALQGFVKICSGAIFLEGNYPRGQLSGGQLSGSNHPRGIYKGGNYPESNFPRRQLSCNRF